MELGDFNATAYAGMLGVFSWQPGLIRVTDLPIWPIFGPNLAQFSIEHIITSAGLILSGPANKGRDNGSGHLPVAVRMVVPQANGLLTVRGMT